MISVAVCKRNVLLLLFEFFIFGVYGASDSLKPSDIYDTPNVRTVLFRKNDLEKPCWGLNNAGLLANRYAMQTLLPRRLPNDVAAFLKYVLVCVKTVDEELKTEEAKDVLLEALSDTFGGYLQAFILPAAKRAYYEGDLDYDTCLRLYTLEDEFKTALKTNGGSWAGPALATRKIKRKTPALEIERVENACDKIIFDNGKQKKERECKNATDEDCQRQSETQIPIPFFDDCKHPNAVAIPFKNCTLYSLMNKASRLVLVKYYEMSLSCLNERCKRDGKESCKRKKTEFNKKYYSFLTRNVMPRLDDTSWYPAFYKVVPLIMMVKRSIPPQDGGCNKNNGSWTMPPKGFKLPFSKDAVLSALRNFIACAKWTFSRILRPLMLLFLAVSSSLLGVCSYLVIRWRINRSLAVKEQDCSASIKSCLGKIKGKGDKDTVAGSGTPCTYCACNTRAKASFKAKFYSCKKLPPEETSLVITPEQPPDEVMIPSGDGDYLSLQGSQGSQDPAN